MKPGSAETRGFGYDDLKSINPSLIYCAISAFGQSGPLSNLPGYDPLMQAFTGIMSTTGNDGDDPVRVGVSLIDIGTGMWSAMGILAGVLERSRSGRGILVEASLMDTGITWMSVFVASYLATQKLPRKMGSAMAMTAPYELFRSADGYVFIAAGNDALFKRVCEGLGRPEIAGDERFLTNPQRVANREALHAALEDLTRKRTSADVVADLRRAGAPCSELNDVSQVLSNEHVKVSEIIADLPIEGAPQHRVVALPLKANGERCQTMRPPPALGADTNSILADLGYEPADIERLRETRIIG